MKGSEAQSGTTATVCLLRNSVELVVAHVGDSRALLCRNGLAQKLTFDHTAALFSEKVTSLNVMLMRTDKSEHVCFFIRRNESPNRAVRSCETRSVGIWSTGDWR